MSDEESALSHVPRWARPILEARLPDGASIVYVSYDDEEEIALLALAGRAIVSCSLKAKLEEHPQKPGLVDIEAAPEVRSLPLSAVSAIVWQSRFRGRSEEGRLSDSEFERERFRVELATPLPPWGTAIELPRRSTDYNGDKAKQDRAVARAAARLHAHWSKVRDPGLADS